MSYDIKKGTVVSHVETDPYIPLNIYFGEVDFDVDRMGFCGPRGELLEVAASFYSREVKELTLVHCEGIELQERAIEVPAVEDGVVYMEASDHNDVPTFGFTVYSDGAHIRLEGSPSDEYTQMGNVVFGFNRKVRSLSEVFIGGLSLKKVLEITDAVQYTLSQKDVILTFDDVTGE